MSGSIEDSAPDETRGPGENGGGNPPSRLPAVTAAGLTRRARVGAKQVVRKQVPGGSRYAFRVDVTSMFLMGLYTGAVFPFVNVIARDDLKASGQVLALLTAAPFIGNLMAMFWARAMEGRPKVPFVKWSWFAARICVSLTLFAKGAWPFALAVSLAQIIGTIATPAWAAVMKAVYPDEQRGRILSYTRATILVAQVASTLFAGWLLHRLHAGGYQVVFCGAAIIGMLSSVVFGRIYPREAEELANSGEEAPTQGSIGRKLRETGRFVWNTLGILREDEAYRWFAFSVFTYGFGNLMTVPLQPIVQVDELHIHKEQIAVLTNLSQIVAIIAYFYWGRYVDRFSPQRAVVLNVLINALVPVVYIGTALLGGNAWSLLPAFVFQGIVQAGIDLSYFNALLTFSGPNNVSRYQSLQSFLLGVRGTIAPFVGSTLAIVLKDHGLNIRYAFAVGAVMMLTGAWMQSQAMKRQALQLAKA